MPVSGFYGSSVENEDHEKHTKPALELAAMVLQ